jgi:hypothetical protein
MSSLQIVLLEPARAVLAQVSQFLMSILLFIIILIIGWLISGLVKASVTKLLRALKIDDLSDRIELDALLEKGGIKYSLSELVGTICYWLALLVTFMVSVNAVGLTVAAELLDKVLLYIPHVVAAIFILVLGMFAATLLKNIVLAAANNAGLSQSKLLADIGRVVVVAFSIFVALEQLKIGIRITELTLAIILGSVGLAFALSFGLGCKDIAGKFMADLVDQIKKK